MNIAMGGDDADITDILGYICYAGSVFLDYQPKVCTPLKTKIYN